MSVVNMHFYCYRKIVLASKEVSLAFHISTNQIHTNKLVWKKQYPHSHLSLCLNDIGTLGPVPPPPPKIFLNLPLTCGTTILLAQNYNPFYLHTHNYNSFGRKNIFSVALKGARWLAVCAATGIISYTQGEKYNLLQKTL